jgi:hypothetical protein
MFVFGAIAFTLIFYIVLSLTTPLDHVIIIILAAAIGLVGGAIWLGFWWYAGIPVLSELLVGLVLGFLFSSVLFYTPFGKFSIATLCFFPFPSPPPLRIPFPQQIGV